MLLVEYRIANLLSFAFWLQPVIPFGWFLVTMVQSWIQAVALLMDSLLARTTIGLGVLKAFTPALRIDGIATVGDVVQNYALCAFTWHPQGRDSHPQSHSVVKVRVSLSSGSVIFPLFSCTSINLAANP